MSAHFKFKVAGGSQHNTHRFKHKQTSHMPAMTDAPFRSVPHPSMGSILTEASPFLEYLKCNDPLPSALYPALNDYLAAVTRAIAGVTNTSISGQGQHASPDCAINMPSF